jgi:hypothetical protein
MGFGGVIALDEGLIQMLLFLPGHQAVVVSSSGISNWFPAAMNSFRFSVRKFSPV